MSNALAIAAVTTTLRNLLTQRAREELESGTVTTLPPDKARVNGDSASQINIFLYQTLPNAAWRNQDITNRVKPGETGQPPLALTLYYLITAYGNNNDDIKAHRLLGTAMQVLHDQAALPTTAIKNALAESDLHNQVERVRISPVSLSLEELSKLWSSFQTQYRLSAAYEVSVVLIESKRPVKTPLPVIARGAEDKGFPVVGNLIPPFPTLEEVKLPSREPSVRLGESLTLRGHHLISSEKLDATVRLMHPHLTEPHEIKPQIKGIDSELEVQFPLDSQELLAGFYSVTVSFKKESIIRETNALSFSLAPKIQNIDPSILAEGSTLTITCTPHVWPEQQVFLLVGDREFLPQFNSGKRTFTEKTNKLEFDLRGISPGEYCLRLRVDGVDSLLVDYSKQPPVFDAAQKVTVQS